MLALPPFIPVSVIFRKPNRERVPTWRTRLIQDYISKASKEGDDRGTVSLNVLISQPAETTKAEQLPLIPLNISKSSPKTDIRPKAHHPMPMSIMALLMTLDLPVYI